MRNILTIFCSIAVILYLSGLLSFCDNNNNNIAMMAAGYKIPPVFTEAKPYLRWVDEIKVWQTVTDLDKKKQAPAIALYLPEREGTIRDKVFNELGIDQLCADNGVETLIKYMDKLYKLDDLSEAYELYTDFYKYRKSKETLMENYII